MAYTSRITSQFNPYAVGNKIYGGGRPFPTSGPVDPLGYRERDLATRARRDAMLRRLKASMNQDYMSADYLRNV